MHRFKSFWRILKLKFEIEGKPQPKERPRVTKYHTYTPSKTESYEKLVAWTYKLFGGMELHGAIEFELIVHYKIAKSNKKVKLNDYHTYRPDLDNVIKTVLDGLGKVAYKNDSQISSIKAKKIWDTKDFIEIKITEIMEE